MITYKEGEYLMLSGIQHFAFCRRQWALIHIESAWADNYFTTDGILKHKRAHKPNLSEKRKDIITVGDMPIHSSVMGVSGKCDIVEFIKSESGVPLHGRSGRWLPVPIEYKRGSPKVSDADRLQLCTKAICLEEMLVCPEIESAFLFYYETRHREKVSLTKDLRDKVKVMFAEMHLYFAKRHTPRVRPNKACKACSLKEICLPKLPKPESVAAYINRELAGEI